MTNSGVKNMGWFKRQKKEESTETVTEIESQEDTITPEEPQQEEIPNNTIDEKKNDPLNEL